MDKYNSNFITYELEPGNYNFEDLSKSIFNILQPKYLASSKVIFVEFDDFFRRTKLIVREGNLAIRFDEKSFFHTVLGYNYGWDYKQFNEYMSQNIVKLKYNNKIHLKCDVIDGSILSGVRQPIFYSFVLDKLQGYEVFSQPETVHYKK